MKEQPISSYSWIDQIKYGILSLIGSIICFAGLFFIIPAIFRRGFRYQGSFNYPGVIAATLISALGILLVLLSYKFFKGKEQKRPISSPVLIFASLFLISMATLFFILIYIVRVMPPTVQGGKAIGGGYAIGFAGLWHVYRRNKRTE